MIHYPVGNGADDKREAFQREVARKLDRGYLDFSGAQFPSLRLPETGLRLARGCPIFTGAEFHSAVDSDWAIFEGVAAFSSTIFHESASFSGAAFHYDADFRGAEFHGNVDFSHASFTRQARFSHAVFHEHAEFDQCHFREAVSFDWARVCKSLWFSGSDKTSVFEPGSSLNLQFATFDRPEAVVFSSVRLHPAWFVNTDAGKFAFTKVTWPQLARLRWIWEDLQAVKTGDPKAALGEPEESLSIACQRLAVNSEENQRYDDASAFRYAAMDLRRRSKKFRGLLWRLEWWYWFASGYSERLVRSAAVLAGIWFLFTFLYTQVNFVRWEPKVENAAQARTAVAAAWIQPLKFTEALGYSAAVMTLQKPEPRPSSLTAKNLVLLETILGPLQAALLALTVRRRFMRT